MKLIIFCTLLLIVIVPTITAAKRIYIEHPDNITINDIKYQAAYEDGLFFHTAFVKATNIKTKETIWKKKIYSTLMNPVMEHDVQWVMIKRIEFKNDLLLIENEENKQFLLKIEEN